MITSQEWIDLLDNAELDAQPYSGRGMFGAECVSVVVDSIVEAITDIAEAIADIDEGERRDHWRTMRRTSQDTMGRDKMVLYWPSMKWPTAAEADAEEEEA